MTKILSCGNETFHLRLGLEPTCWDSNLAKTHSLPTEITHLVSEPNEAETLDVSSQKEISEKVIGKKWIYLERKHSPKKAKGEKGGRDS